MMGYDIQVLKALEQNLLKITSCRRVIPEWTSRE